MGDCCKGRYDSFFDDRFAQRNAKRYRKRGLTAPARRVVEFLAGHGIEGASVLEIGGGAGELHVELLRRGAAHVTNLEISTSYEAEAEALLARTGMTERVTRRMVDIATSPDEVEPADVVVLHRVVCCYPDYERLLGAAAGHALRLLVYSHPPRYLAGEFALKNLVRRINRTDFETYVHPPRAMVATASATGMTTRFRHSGLVWDVVGLERTAGADSPWPSAPPHGRPAMGSGRKPT